MGETKTSSLSEWKHNILYHNQSHNHLDLVGIPTSLRETGSALQSDP
ncbi:hypothetical protein LEP1GSC103_3990 [Leptospira borgpetersenii serovar Javanica str. UI 09931]|uniref:Uncharacterized protein n=3 Tax=Leptospira borgpetersenii TaxID=174 RepID=A0A0S2IMN5_LEPBO|nr:hypothetical protein LBBP_00594 [Leptospira borgpetersenii serovar Ballum]EKQ91162.1 hypothetical protein LEP1GSC101_1495 [Leptospira borgpetersenii str. UI 09149]EKR02327.1 hypothetical protein LEP1GSC121_0884 [Leptospira borgpetersenii serovar Castellonis str. 200801910]EMK14064.1 hypothetical protein LEP1GSC066_1323 [Leptospira sp. serovar Kenya str. Sh9]EMN18678.1 hypothetical protein LEP1GSC056_4021 [Leptospira borgpetersenii str. Brem 328]EMN56393.1 hypothetical protein LEP1GSC090_198